MTDRALAVVRAGALTTVQDRGRPGHAHLGVPRSGALDGPAAALANRLAGNPADAAVLETTLNGCALRPRSPVVVAVTGAPCPVTVDGRPVAWGAPVPVRAGSVLDVGAATSGVRAYVAVSGGIAVDPVLGSRSTDLLSGLGPAPSRTARSSRSGLRRDTRRAWTSPRSRPPGRTRPARDAGPARRLVHPGGAPGPHVRYVPRVSREQPHRTAHDRAALERARPEELPSEGVVLGAVQVPPDGRPVVFLADHPTTGATP